MVYGTLTQPALDRQYDARATVGGDIEPFLSAYAKLTERARSACPCHIGLRYGATEPERLDVYPAASKTASPVFVYFHGGYWRLLDSADAGFMADCLTHEGVCVVAINYALAPSVSLGEIVRQCRAALKWVHRNIAAYGGDPNRIHVSGSSAGGHIAGMMLAAGWQRPAGLPADVVASASLFSGLYDLEPVRLSSVNGWARLDASSAEALSPIRHLPANMPRLLFALAPSDTDEFARQTIEYRQACDAVGCDTRLMVVPRSNHFDIVLQLCDPASALAKAVLDLVHGS
jgi:arylformamidase